MDIFFIGVGDACDPLHGNTSVHVQTSNNFNILFDCGFTVPHSYFAFTEKPDQLDMIWLSHFHGDHFFGLPLLLLRLWEMERTKPLIIGGQDRVADKVLAAMDLAYSGFRQKLRYELQFRVLEPGDTALISGVACQSVQTDHSERNLGLLVDDGEKKFYYSGDGRPTRDVEHLARDCDIAVHEAFRLNEEVKNHGSIRSCLKLVETANIKRLALVHLDRKIRREDLSAIEETIRAYPVVLLPEAGSLITI